MQFANFNRETPHSSINIAPELNKKNEELKLGRQGIPVEDALNPGFTPSFSLPVLKNKEYIKVKSSETDCKDLYAYLQKKAVFLESKFKEISSSVDTVYALDESKKIVPLQCLFDCGADGSSVREEIDKTNNFQHLQDKTFTIHTSNLTNTETYQRRNINLQSSVDPDLIFQAQAIVQKRLTQAKPWTPELLEILAKLYNFNEDWPLWDYRPSVSEAAE